MPREKASLGDEGAVTGVAALASGKRDEEACGSAEGVAAVRDRAGIRTGKKGCTAGVEKKNERSSYLGEAGAGISCTTYRASGTS